MASMSEIERTIIYAYKWGHISKEELIKKLGVIRARQLGYI